MAKPPPGSAIDLVLEGREILGERRIEGGDPLDRLLDVQADRCLVGSAAQIVDRPMTEALADASGQRVEEFR